VRFLVHAPLNGTAPPVGAALTPTLVRSSTGWRLLRRIYGQPGTQGIPVDDPAAIRENVNSYANIGQFSSQNAPNVIFPPLYWDNSFHYQGLERAPVARISDDQLPVPARRAKGYILAKPYQARQGGQRQVRQPQVVQRWKGMYQS